MASSDLVSRLSAAESRGKRKRSDVRAEPRLSAQWKKQKQLVVKDRRFSQKAYSLRAHPTKFVVFQIGSNTKQPRGKLAERV